MPLRGVRRPARVTGLMAALVAALVAALATAVTGCTSSATTTVSHHTDTPRASASSLPPTLTPTTAASAERPAAITEVPAEFGGSFVSPTGNIQCAIENSLVQCAARQQPWRDLPISSTDDCVRDPSQWRTTVWLEEDKRAYLRGDCYDVLDGEPKPAVLGYGHGLQVGRMRCVSTRAGIDCLVVDTRKGFFVSREAYRLTARRTPSTTGPIAPQPSAGTLMAVPYGFAGGFHRSDWGIVCALTDSDAHCLFNDRADWNPPPRTEPCDFDRSTEVEVGASGRGRAFTGCRSDTLGGGPALHAGHGIRIGAVECWMRGTALDCRNNRTGHGFTVSERRFRGY